MKARRERRSNNPILRGNRLNPSAELKICVIPTSPYGEISCCQSSRMFSRKANKTRYLIKQNKGSY